MMKVHHQLNIIFSILIISSQIHMIQNAPSNSNQNHPPSSSSSSTANKFLENFYQEILNKANNDNNASSSSSSSLSSNNSDNDSSNNSDEDRQFVEDETANNSNLRRNSERFKRNLDSKRVAIDKQNMIKYVQLNILKNIRRTVNSSKILNATNTNTLNFENINKILPKFNSSSSIEDIATQEVIGFNPSCVDAEEEEEEEEEEEQENDSNNNTTMNLNFNFKLKTDDTRSISSSILRLYSRRTQNISNIFNLTTTITKDNCENEEEIKLLRVSVYWHIKFSNKIRDLSAKKRLSDSKVIPENARWIDLNVKPAVKMWKYSGNNAILALSVVLEDEDGKLLKTDKYFLGASSCTTVGIPSLPAILRDRLYNQRSEENAQFSELLGNDSTTASHKNGLLSPTIDICLVKFPDNVEIPLTEYNKVCNENSVEKQRDIQQKIFDKLFVQETPINHPIRHNKHHNKL